MLRQYIFLLILALGSLVSGCSSPDKKAPKPLPQIAQEGTHYTTVIFEKGKTHLNQLNKNEIKALIAEAHKKRKKIAEIRILAWADQEYPEKTEKRAKTGEIILASERAQVIREYLEKDLKELEDVDSYNMAKRPGLLSKLFRNDEFAIKRAFEASGTTGSKLPDGSMSYTKASKAILIIDYEGKEDNLK